MPDGDSAVLGRPGRWPSARTTVVGVIGDPVAHSLSPLLHNTAFVHLGLDWVSVGFAVPEGQAAQAMAGMRALGLHGLSVTMPHKGTVARLVDRRTPVAERLGAVNCVRRLADGQLVGENTDGAGFLAALRRGARFEVAGRRCMVAGAGGAGRAVVLALVEAGAGEVVVVNRTAGPAETVVAMAGPGARVGEPDEAPQMDLVVKATPAGMAGTPSAPLGCLVDPATLGAGQLAVDLVYDPAVTPWLEAARLAGADTLGGLGMLVHQAALQLTAWTGQEPPLEAMWAAANQQAG